MNRIEHQPSFILKSQAFKETSLIHQVFTQDHGVVSILSKGSRAKNSKYGSLLQSFRGLSISWSGKSDLKTLLVAEEWSPISPLVASSLYCGFYINELLLNLLHKHDAHPVLFSAYKNVIQQLSNNERLEANLRQFEKLLFDEIGYGLALEHEANSLEPLNENGHYQYKPGVGALVESNPLHPNDVLGRTIINLKNNKLTDKYELAQAKRLMRRLIDTQLDGKI